MREQKSRNQQKFPSREGMRLYGALAGVGERGAGRICLNRNLQK